MAPIPERLEFLALALALVLFAGCGGTPPAQMQAREPSRTEGITVVGMPESRSLASCDSLGRWNVGAQPIDHWIVDPENARGPVQEPAQGSPKQSFFRSTLPFPEVTWGAGDFEVTELLYPSGAGFVARYHVMNHGSETRRCRLVIGRRTNEESSASSEASPADELSTLVPVEAPSERTKSHLAYDLKIEAGGSQFVQVTTAELGGRIPEDALDQAARRWTEILGDRKLTLPDPALMRAYYAERAGLALGLKGCREAVAKIEERVAQQEGKTIRLLPGLPPEWAVETIEAQALPTEFGPLGFSYQGAFNSRTLDLDGSCQPPEGFLISVPPGLKATVDGQPREPQEGILRLPPGTRRLELDRRR